jgi:hypothetical protein
MNTKKRKQFFLVIGISLLTLFHSTALAQDSIYARNVITTLTSPAFKGRGYAFKGDSIAASFISKEFARFNLNKWTDNYYQPYTVSINVFEGNKEVNFGESYPSSTCSDALHIAVYSAPAKGKFSIIPATKKMLNPKWDTSKTKDKFVAVDMIRYSSNEKKRTQWNQTILKNPIQAKGYILLDKQLPIYSPVKGRVKASHTTIVLLKDSVSGALKEVNMDLDARFIEQYTTQNVCGYVKGKLYPDTFFVIGAHYDHLGQIGKGTDYIFHGANDNASGTTMMMDLARHFSLAENQPDYSIAFVAFSGEEIGLLGSFHFVANSTIPLKNIKMMLNLDMVGTGEDGFTFVCGKAFPDEFDKFVNINNEKHYTSQLLPREETANSDHYPFYKEGCKAMFVFSMGGKAGGYHHPADTVESLSMGGYSSLVRLIIDYINLHNSK